MSRLAEAIFNGMSRNLPLTVLVATMLVACSRTNQQDDLSVSVNSIMQSIADTARFNGNVLVARAGKVVYQKSFGLADFYSEQPLNDSSIFELASVSKQFTAMGIMILKERGKLTYEEDVRKYIPELPYGGMTIRHFLTHTSGIPDYMEHGLSSGRWDPKKIVYNDDIIALLATHKPPVNFKPGEKWEYSNTAYALLASIIGRVSGQPYGEFLRANIFEPLGMKHTRTYNTRRSKREVIPNYAYGFVYSDSLKKYTLPDSVKSLYFVYTLDGIEGDGIVNSTSMDLFRWNEALYTEKLVKQATIEEAFTPVVLADGTKEDYGFGWGIASDSTLGRIVEHSGGWPGYGTYIRRYLDSHDCVILLSNNGGYGRRSALEEIDKALKNGM